MDSHIFIALVGALVNAGLSVTVPCLVKNSEQPFLKQVIHSERFIIKTPQQNLSILKRKVKQKTILIYGLKNG